MRRMLTPAVGSGQLGHAEDVRKVQQLLNLVADENEQTS